MTSQQRAVIAIPTALSTFLQPRTPITLRFRRLKAQSIRSARASIHTSPVYLKIRFRAVFEAIFFQYLSSTANRASVSSVVLRDSDEVPRKSSGLGGFPIYRQTWSLPTSTCCQLCQAAGWVFDEKLRKMSFWNSDIRISNNFRNRGFRKTPSFCRLVGSPFSAG